MVLDNPAYHTPHTLSQNTVYTPHMYIYGSGQPCISHTTHPQPKYRVYTAYIYVWFWPTLHITHHTPSAKIPCIHRICIYMVLDNPAYHTPHTLSQNTVYTPHMYIYGSGPPCISHTTYIWFWTILHITHHIYMVVAHPAYHTPHMYMYGSGQPCISHTTHVYIWFWPTLHITHHSPSPALPLQRWQPWAAGSCRHSCEGEQQDWRCSA